MGRKGAPHCKWSKKEKLRIIIEHLEGQTGIRELSRKYQIESGTVTNWVRTYL